MATTDWSFLNSNSSLQSKYDHFVSILKDIIKENVPLRQYNANSKVKRPKFLKILLKKKLKYYKLYKSGRCSKKDYKNVVREYESAVQAWNNSKENKFLKNPNSRKFYSHVKKKLNCKFAMPPLINPSGVSTSSDDSKANLLNETFQKSFSSDDNLPLFPCTQNIPGMLPFQITPSDVYNSILSCKDKISRTPEEIPSFFIKRISQYIILPLTYLYNLSLTSGDVPTQWKLSLITPVFKKGNKKLPTNYRPIAQTSSFCRILESIFFNKILSHIQTNSILSDNQFGFIPNKSSCSQLLFCLHTWLSSFCSKTPTFVAYTDISKAFDTVNHRKLIIILNSIKLPHSLTSWIKNYLTDRKQKVFLNSVSSKTLPVLSGIPQGSILGPLLFLIYMNNIIKSPELANTDTKIILYADDTKIFSPDLSKIQSTLNNFNLKLQDHQLHLAPHKCAILPISNKPFKNIISCLPAINIDSTPLPFIETIKDLGIQMSSNLKWNHHITKIVNKAKILSYQITKTFKTRNIWTLLKLFKTYIRPQLDYNTPVWSPHLQQDINAVESVQRRFTKTICRRCNIPFTSYEDRLFKLDILSLENRRIQNDVILLFKILHGLSDISFNKFFKLQISNYSLRGPSSKIIPVQTFNNTLWKNSFFERAPRYYNKLPSEISSAKSLNVFKFKLKQVNYSHLKFNYK